MTNEDKKLNPETLSSLCSSWLFTPEKILYLDETSSTNDVAKKMAIEGSPEGTTVIAEFQTLGRGRSGRQWESPKYLGIYFSFILKPDINKELIPYITMLTGIAAAEAIKEETDLDSRMKWPNDIIINDKKVCGILVEGSTVKDNLEFLIVGIGVNVNNDFFPGNYLYPPTSLKIEKGDAVSRENILRKLLEKIEIWYHILIKQKKSSLILKRCRELSHSIGKNISIRMVNESLTGYVMDIDKTGYLILKTESGEIIKIPSGEIIG